MDHRRTGTGSPHLPLTHHTDLREVLADVVAAAAAAVQGQALIALAGECAGERTRGLTGDEADGEADGEAGAAAVAAERGFGRTTPQGLPVDGPTRLWPDGGWQPLVGTADGTLPAGALATLCRRERLHSVALVPLVARAQCLGLILAGRRHQAELTPAEIAGLQNLAASAAATVDSLLLARRVAELEATRDHRRDMQHLARRARTLLERLPVGICLVDNSRRVTFINGQGRDFLARLGHVDVARGSAFLALPGSSHLEAVLTGRAPADAFLYEVGPDLSLEVRITRVDGPGDDPGVLIVLTDVTQVRQQELSQQRGQQAAFLGQLAATAAHEIRNPLATIRGLLELARGQGAATDDAVIGARQYRVMLGELDRIDGIAADLLGLGRSQRVRPGRIDLAQLLADTAVLYAAAAAERGIDLVRAWGGGPIWARGDARLLMQVLHNLVRNALQSLAARPEPRVLRLAAGTKATEAWCRVEDTGPGVGADERERLFVPFATNRPEGTGLGLAISQALVQAMAGRIEVAAGPEGGAAFTVWLPGDPGDRGRRTHGRPRTARRN